MKVRTRFFFIATVTISIALCGSSGNAEPWEITLHLDNTKQIFLVGEPIYFTQLIENAGVARDTFWFDEKGSFLVHDANGDSIFTPFNVSVYSEPQLVFPNEPRIVYLNLSDLYFCVNIDKGVKFLEPGDYKIQTRIRIRDKSHPRQGLKFLYSETTPIKIIAPEGFEKEIFDKYKTSLEYFGKPKRYDYCEDIYKNYPNSVYAPESYKAWIWGKLYGGKSYLWQVDELLKLLEKYPDHPRAKTWISSVIVALGGAKRPDLVSSKLAKIKSMVKNQQLIDEIDVELHKYNTGYYKEYFNK